MSPPKASTTIPLPLRLVLLLLEPLGALNGAYLTLFTPSSYHSAIARPHPPSWSPPFSPQNQYLYTQLAGAWLVFAFNESVILWLYDDLKLWKLMCWGMLISDLVYHVSAVQAVGGWERFLGVGGWNLFDWAVAVSAAGPAVVRVWICLFAGEKGGREKGKGE
uniref:DUF7704 domain-containing protein n=1 Tax=Podospora anserina (strain S / ATCC MYA-4624 / DSM 980 / FGSC 10383) TaxID=515849 RepID=A0A090DAB1_PODAN|nr:Putative protein of unknown function [Podospora anserina S mat+]